MLLLNYVLYVEYINAQKPYHFILYIYTLQANDFILLLHYIFIFFTVRTVKFTLFKIYYLEQYYTSNNILLLIVFKSLLVFCYLLVVWAVSNRRFVSLFWIKLLRIPNRIIDFEFKKPSIFRVQILFGMTFVIYGDFIYGFKISLRRRYLIVHNSTVL